jgi:hypothetical protein
MTEQGSPLRHTVEVRLRRTIEAVGLLGVVASMLFVGLEVRQNSAATRAGTAQEVSSGFRDINLMLAGDRELLRILVEYRLNPETASLVDQAQIRAFYRALFHVWSNMYYQNLNGTVDPQIYDAMVTEASTYAKAGARSVFWVWETERYVYPVEFGAFMDSIAATAVTPDLELLDSIGRGR